MSDNPTTDEQECHYDRDRLTVLPTYEDEVTKENWPFGDPPNVATFTTVNVLERGASILLVTHDADDGAWQFMCGTTNDPEDARIVALHEILALDPTVAGLADLPIGWKAWRDSEEDTWTRERKETETDA
jgi:hypothetical protein